MSDQMDTSEDNFVFNLSNEQPVPMEVDGEPETRNSLNPVSQRNNQGRLLDNFPTSRMAIRRANQERRSATFARRRDNTVTVPTNTNIGNRILIRRPSDSAGTPPNGQQQNTGSRETNEPVQNGGRRTRKRVPWAGWSKQKPSSRQRTVMKRKCGKKCFLGPKKSFPVCKKNTCKVSSKGLWAAYVRAKEWGKKSTSYKGKARPTMKRRVYTKVAKKSRNMLRRRGFKVGKSTRKNKRK